MARAKVHIDSEKNEVVIRLPIQESMSVSGKMKLITTTGGNQETDTTYEGKSVYANVNVGIFVTPGAKPNS